MEKLYIDQFTDYHTYVQVGEYKIPLPKKPANSEIINFGLPIEEQVITPTRYNINGSWIYAHKLTKSIWTKLSESQREEIARTEWKRRHNGCWYMNGGRLIYVPGNQYFFINYWTFPNGTRPVWWDSQWFSFLLTDWAFHHKKILAKVKIKGRRGGGSAEEDNNCLDYTTKYKGSVSGIMNKNLEEAKKLNFDKIVHALLNLPEFFQPKRSGEKRPSKEIFFAPPSKRITSKTDADEEDNYAPDEYLNSYLNFIATSEIGYDGDMMTYIVIDELFKWKNVSPTKAVEIQSLCIKDGGVKNSTLFNGKQIFKGLLSCLSSVEEIADEQLEDVRKLWDSCNPNTETETQISSSGGIRYFEPFFFGFKGYMDKFGYSQVEECRRVHNDLEKQIRKTKGNKAAIDWRRKHPETLDHALLPSMSKSAFNVDILNTAEQNYLNLLPDEQKPVMGNLVWVEKFVSVKWVPMPFETEFSHLARWELSGIPDDAHRNAVSMHSNGNKLPLNRGIYTMAVDPVDHNVDETSDGSKLSNGAACVKREFDIKVDGDKFDAEGEPVNNGFGFETNRTVAVYCYRPDDSEDFWEDMAKGSIFWGAPTMMEATSRGMKKYYIDNNMQMFLLNNDGSQINYSNKDTIGWKASGPAKQQQFEATDNYFTRFGLSERHLSVIRDAKVTNKVNLTHHDVMSAYTILQTVSSILFYKKFDGNNKKETPKRDIINVRKRIIQPGKTTSRWIT